MQNVSAEYIEQMNKDIRNRGHIQVTLGVINKNAQKHAYITELETPLEFYCIPNLKDVFTGGSTPMMYASDEEEYTAVDGSMYFLPPEGSGATYYYNGAVSAGLPTGELPPPYIGYIMLQWGSPQDIKGLTIDFGDAYPTEFWVQTYNYTTSQAVTTLYTNNSRVFRTTDIFEAANYITIIPKTMVGGAQRLRILSANLGVVEVFNDSRVTDCTITDYCSQISDSVPSRDITIKLDNRDHIYSPDNPKSVMTFMEIGQDVTVEFGYDLDEEGTETEWLEPVGAFLTDWSADNSTATITAKDIYNLIKSDKYKEGQVYPWGNPERTATVHDITVSVLADAGIDDYEIDACLNDFDANAPIPVVSHAEALQLIANMARCALKVSRNGSVQIEPAHSIPSFTVSSNTETAYSEVENILSEDDKEAYANDALNFTTVDGSMYFATAERFVGYYSSSAMDGTTVSSSWSGSTPVIVVTPEEVATIFGVTIHFRELYATLIKIRTYDENDDLIEEFTYNNDSVVFDVHDSYVDFSRMEIEFTEAPYGARIVVDRLDFDHADYFITNSMTKQFPIAIRQNIVKTVNVNNSQYYRDDPYEPLIQTREVTRVNYVVPSNRHLTVNIDVQDPWADLDGIWYDQSGQQVYPTYIAQKSSSWYLYSHDVATSTQEIGNLYTFVVRGQHFGVEKGVSTRELLPSYSKGEVVTWDNPIISTKEEGESVADWLADYYKSDMVYNVSWRGDPRIEVGDLVNIESTIGEKTLVRIFQNTLNYNGAWSGSFQARKVTRNVVDNS